MSAGAQGAGSALKGAGSAVGAGASAAAGAASGAQGCSRRRRRRNCAAQQARNLWCQTTGFCAVQEVICK